MNSSAGDHCSGHEQGVAHGEAARPPVILVHGIWDTSRKMQRLATHLRREGRVVHAVSLHPADGSAGLDELAAQLRDFVDHAAGKTERIDLIGFSMGGLISRYYLQRLGGLARTRRFITLSSPHRGSLWAWMVDNPGCRQMRPGSAFLRDLDSDGERLREAGFKSFWSPLDLMILPSWSSVTPLAKCEQFWCVAHPLMVSQSACLRAVARELGR